MVQNTNLKDIMQKNQTSDFFIACKESRIEKNTSFYGCFFLGPFDDSLSQTLANDLRRTLLSELTGLAITSIEIEGVLHKFSILPGMKESVLDLICNLQNIVLKKSVNSFDTTTTKLFKKTFIGFLNVNGPRVIKAKDLKLPAGLQCVDPNQYIATLAEDGILNMKFNINEGKNFIKQKQYNLDVNVLKKRNILLHQLAQTNGFSNFRRKTLTLNKNIMTNNNQLSQTTKKYPIGVEKALLNFSPQGSSTSPGTSVPIPLDAVFMPVSKINCIIEENNLFSDFSTDSLPISNSKSTLNLDSCIKDNLKLEIKKSLTKLDYNMVYQTCFVLTNKSKNDTRINKNGAKDQLLNKKIKFVPFVTDSKLNSINWSNASNLLYFKVDNTTLQNILFSVSNVLNKTNFVLSTNVFDIPNLKTDAEGSRPNLYSAQPNPEIKKGIPETYTPNLVGEIQNASAALHQDVNIKNFSKIKTFLVTKNMKKTTGVIISQGDTILGQSKEEQIYMSQLQCRTTTDIIKNKNIKNSLSQKILSNIVKMPLDYTNLLKLKPLRKKSHLILEIWTNGSIHPRQALLQSCRFLTNNFIKLQTVKMLGSRFRSELAYANLKYSLLTNYLSNYNNKLNYSLNNTNITSQLTKMHKTGNTSIIEDKEFEPSLTNLNAPLSILNISLRSYTILKKSGIFTLNDLIKYSKKNLLQKQNFGLKSLDEIETSLSILGLHLKN